MIDADLCPHCLSVATEIGRQLRASLEKSLAARGGTAGVLANHARLRERAGAAMREFSLRAILPPLPEWAVALADPRTPLPPGAEQSRAKSAAISNLRLEHTAARLALDSLGYAGLAAEAKLEAALAEGNRAAAKLAGWDGIIALASQEHELRRASEVLLANDASAGTILETIKTRDVSRVIDAAVRRGRAVDSCRHVLGIA